MLALYRNPKIELSRRNDQKNSDREISCLYKVKLKKFKMFPLNFEKRENASSSLTLLYYSTLHSFYSVIDEEIRKVVYGRGIHVRMLLSNWSSSNPQQIYFLKSLKEFGKMPNINGSLSVVSYQFLYLCMVVF